MKFQNVMILMLCYFTWFCEQLQCRIHRLNIEDDDRNQIKLTSFGFFKGGYLYINFENFHFNSTVGKDQLFGFTFEKLYYALVAPMNKKPYRERCILSDSEKVIEKKENVVFFTMDLEKNRLLISYSADSEIEKLRIYEDIKQLPITSYYEQASIKDGKKHENQNDDENLRGASCVNLSLPLTKSTTTSYYNTKFAIYIPTEHEEGLYDIFFYNCANYNDNGVVTFFSVLIEEYNVGNYLSAGEMPLPALYFIMSVIFLLSVLFWIRILVKNRHSVFKIHYLMGALALLKTFELLFRGINYHYIEIKGERVTAWVILYNVTHLLIGPTLYIIIILISTGCTFIKHILSPKQTKTFMIVIIPLQVVLSNIAEIILDELEEGDAEHEMWFNVFTNAVSVCNIALLLPCLWAMINLNRASQTNGKDAINLQKLKLIRHFHFMIVFYLTFSIMIAVLLKIRVPFGSEWSSEMCKEIATFVFFVLTGFKFRPASSNPLWLVAL